MIWSILVTDSSGVPIYSWTHPRAPESILEKYEPSLIAGFINAIIQFGHEILAQPQRIDFGQVAMSFHSYKAGERVFWFAILSDSKDSRKATAKFLERFVREAREIFLEVSVVEGFTVSAESLEAKLNELVKRVLRKMTRALPDLRSDDKRAFLPAVLITTITALYISTMFNLYIYPKLEVVPSDLMLLALVSLLLLQYTLIGIVSGIVSSRMISGAISAYIASLASAILALDNILSALIISSWFGLWSGLIGALVGKYFDSMKLLG